MLGWEAVRAGGSTALAAYLGRQFVRRGEPAPPATPVVEALATARLSCRIVRVPGHAAHWDPWRGVMVLGEAWTVNTWEGVRVLAHERAHAAQPRWRLRLAASWIKAATVIGLVVGVALPAWGLWPWIVASITFIGWQPVPTPRHDADSPGGAAPRAPHSPSRACIAV